MYIVRDEPCVAAAYSVILNEGMNKTSTLMCHTYNYQQELKPHVNIHNTLASKLLWLSCDHLLSILYTTSVTPVGSFVLGVIALYIICNLWLCISNKGAGCYSYMQCNDCQIGRNQNPANKHSRRLTSSYVCTLVALLTSEGTFPALCA